MKYLLLLIVLFESGCVFVGHRQTLSEEPIRFYDETSGLDIREVLIVPLYCEGDEMSLAAPFVYQNGEQFVRHLPVSVGFWVATTYVGTGEGIRGFAVFAKGYAAKYGGYGEEIGKYDLETRESLIRRQVGLIPSIDLEQEALSWLLSVLEQENMELSSRHAEIWGIGIPYVVKNEIGDDGIRLIREYAENCVKKE